MDYFPKSDSETIPSETRPLMDKGTKFFAKKAVKPIAEYFGVDPETAETAFEQGVSVGNFIKERADAHSLVNFLPETEMDRLVKSGSLKHYDERNYNGESFQEAFPRLRGTALRTERERQERRQQATEDRNKQPDPPEDKSEMIKNIIDQEREDRDIKTIREIVRQSKFERENPDKVGEEKPPDLDELFTYSEADNLKRDEELEYINLTRGGFIYLHSGTGDTGGRFVNYANNPYGLDDSV